MESHAPGISKETRNQRVETRLHCQICFPSIRYNTPRNVHLPVCEYAMLSLQTEVSWVYRFHPYTGWVSGTPHTRVRRHTSGTIA